MGSGHTVGSRDSSHAMPLPAASRYTKARTCSPLLKHDIVKYLKKHPMKKNNHLEQTIGSNDKGKSF